MHLAMPQQPAFVPAACAHYNLAGLTRALQCNCTSLQSSQFPVVRSLWMDVDIMLTI